MPSFTKTVQDQLNAELVDVDQEAGTATLRTFNKFNEPVDQQVDYRAMKADLEQRLGTPLELTEADAPLKDSGLSFIQQFAMAESKTFKDKMNFLKGEIGADNVRFNKETGEFSVWKDGVWKRGELSEGFKGTVAELVGQTGLPIAGSIKGAAMGATAGAPLGPVGAAALGVLGAGLGAAVGKLTSIGIAHASGVRTEADAEEISKELGKEFIYGLAGEAIPAVLRGSASLFAKAVNKLRPQLTSDASKSFVAETMSQFNKNSVSDNRTILEYPLDVLKHQNTTINWSDTGAATLKPNPVTVEMTNILKDTVKKVEQARYNEFGGVLDDISEELRSTALDAKMLKQNTLPFFRDLGVIGANGEWLAAADRDLAVSFKPGTISLLKRMYDAIGGAARHGEGILGKEATGVLTLNQGERLLRAVDELGESTLASDVSKLGKKQVAQIRTEIANWLESGVAKVDEEAGAKYSAIRKKYHVSQEWLDTIKPQLEPSRIQNTVQTLIDRDNGMMLREDFKSLLKDVGINADEVIKQLQVRNAGINSAPMWIPNSTASGLGNLAEKTVMAPLTSPRWSTRFAAKLSPGSLADLTAKGNAADMVSKMAPQERMYLLRNPEVLKTIPQTISQARLIHDQRSQELKQYGAARIRGK